MLARAQALVQHDERRRRRAVLATAGTVAEFLVAGGARAFGRFYTLGIESGASAPFLLGLVSDRIGVPGALALLSGLVLVALPLTLPLHRALADRPDDSLRR
jgi:hypothetical protein